MPLDIVLGDVAWRWQLKDDQAAEDWLCRRPWLGEGGVIVVQGADDGDVTLGALEREVHAADCRTSDVRFVRLVTREGHFNEVVADWLNTLATTPRELALALADDLLVRPAIFVLDARRPPARTSWADEASTL